MQKSRTVKTTLRSLFLGIVLGCLAHEDAHAATHRLPESLAYEALSDTVPFVFSPAPFEAVDFAPYWIDSPLSGVTLSLAENSIEWVRVAELVLVPRGRLRIDFPSGVVGSVESEGFFHLSNTKQGSMENGAIELPVALLGTATQYHLKVTVRKPGLEKPLVSRVGIRFKGERFPVEQRVLVDRTCSPSRFEWIEQSLSADEWVYIGCRFVVGWGEKHQVGSLETYVLWSSTRDAVLGGESSSLRWNEHSLEPILPGLYAMRLWSKPGYVSLMNGRELGGKEATPSKLQYRYSLSDRFHNGFLGAGVGPYDYQFASSETLSSGTRPLLTVYGGFFLSDPMRIVFFNATAFDRNYFSDTGLYLNLDQFTALDGHFAFKLLLGMHALAFPANGVNQTNFSLPQGFEASFKDLGGRNRNLLAGAFIYPKINDRSYYNVWVRWGSSRFFGEFNYIKWSELADEQLFECSSIGLSFGGHLWSFL
jgi:hypothetical protein